jgi:tight adherence protein B
MTDFRTFEFGRERTFPLYGFFGIIGCMLSYLFYKNILFVVVMVPFFPKLKSFVEVKFREKRKREYLVQFKDFLFIAATSIGAGRSMKDAIGESLPRLMDIYGKDAVLVPELQIVHRRISDANEDDVTVLMDLALLSGQEDVIDFVTIYSSCKITGASLIRAMNQAAMVIIDKMTIEREITELIRRKEQEGLVILAIPILVIIFLNMSSPDYIAPLYETIRGRLIMTGVIASNVGVYELIQRIVKVDI